MVGGGAPAVPDGVGEGAGPTVPEGPGADAEGLGVGVGVLERGEVETTGPPQAVRIRPSKRGQRRDADMAVDCRMLRSAGPPGTGAPVLAKRPWGRLALAIGLS